jgi:type IV pilus assembly protein PilQ
MNPTNIIPGSRFFRRLGSVCAVCALTAIPVYGQDAGSGDDESVTVTDYGTVTLAVQDTDLAQVLEMLSIQSQKNIITSKNVSATISANLYDVTFYEALDAILKVNGYDYREEGNFIYIYTIQELEEIDAALRQTEARIYNLEYLSASDANEFITPLLSEAGQSAFRGDVEPGIKPDESSVGEDTYAFTAKLVVNDYPENLDQITALLDELDTPPAQVLVEATVLQSTLTEENGFGIDFSIIGDVDFLDFTNPLSGVNNLLAGDDENDGFQPEDNKAQVLNSTPGNTQGPGTLKVGILSNDVAAFLRVLDTVTDTTVLSRPKVMCMNRQRAEVLVGKRVGYLSTTATDTSTTQTVEFLDTGIQLIFRPFISRNGMIRMELAPSVSEADLRDVVDASGTVVTIPDELTNEITTNVRIQDGHTLVLGGLFRESNKTARRQVPVLGDIPLFGAAFRGHDDDVQRSEIIFLITPSVLEDETLYAIGQEGILFTDDAVVGARKGLLFFGRSKQSEAYNNRALAAYNRGDLDEALYHINNSLRIHAQQAEMIHFRDRVMGVKKDAHDRSVMERIFLEDQIGRRTDLDSSFNTNEQADPIARYVEPTPVASNNVQGGYNAGHEPFEESSFENAEPVATVAEENTLAEANNEATDEFGADWFEGEATGAETAETAETAEMVDANENTFDNEADNEVFESEPVNEWSSSNAEESMDEVTAEDVDVTAEELVFQDFEAESNDEVSEIEEMVETFVLPEGWTPATHERFAMEFTDADKEFFVSNFVNKYFTTLGLAYVAPGAMGDANAGDPDAFPFVTFDDLGEVETVNVNEDPAPND